MVLFGCWCCLLVGFALLLMFYVVCLGLCDFVYLLFLFWVFMLALFCFTVLFTLLYCDLTVCLLSLGVWLLILVAYLGCVFGGFCWRYELLGWLIAGCLIYLLMIDLICVFDTWI